MRRPLALLVLFSFAFGLTGLYPCHAEAARSVVPHCQAMGAIASTPGPLLHAVGHGCCGLPRPAGSSASCERTCCLLAILYLPPAPAVLGPSDRLSVTVEERSLSRFVPSIDHIPLSLPARSL